MIEGSDIYEFSLCPYKVYNKYYREKSLMIPPSEFASKLFEEGRRHEKEMVSFLDVAKPQYKWGDFDAGYSETLKLMKQGVSIIYQGLLTKEDYLGIPDLLIREEGKSKLGKWHYIPADIKSATRSKEQHMMQLTFYNSLLEKIQGISEQKGMLILRKSSEYINIEKYKEKLGKALEKIKQMQKGVEYGMHIDTVCRECPWRDVCIPIAKNKHDISLIYGLSRPAHYQLNDLGIKTLEDFEKIDDELLANLNGVGETSIKKWKEQANTIITNKEKITKISIQETHEQICLDIESNENGTVYLIGLLRNNKFVHFLSKNDEEKIIKDFVEYMEGIDNYVIYHYGTIEKTTFRHLFEKYKINGEVAKKIIDQMVDLLQIVRKNTILPLSYYNLKEVAKYFGFSWRASDAGGGNSMVWYDEWVKGNKELLRKILEYNEDDVKATYVVLKKLVKQELP